MAWLASSLVLSLVPGLICMSQMQLLKCSLILKEPFGAKSPAYSFRQIIAVKHFFVSIRDHWIFVCPYYYY